MLHFWSQYGYYGEHQLYWRNDSTRQTSRGFGLVGRDGHVAIFVRRDTGEPLRYYRGEMPDKSLVRSSAPMPLWSIGNVPHGVVIVPGVIPPLLWVGIRWRRLREQRRRVRLGLCLACGYDLRHSPETCPECGAAAASVQRRTNPPAADVPTTTTTG